MGLIPIIGLAAKNAILIVEFAIEEEERGLSPMEAVKSAARLRLRPIIMTSLALIFAMVPLLIAAGPGGGARFAIGLVVAAGMTIGTLFTLFVVPAMYMLLGRDEGHEEAV